MAIGTNEIDSRTRPQQCQDFAFLSVGASLSSLCHLCVEN